MLCVLGLFPWDYLKIPSFQMREAAVLVASRLVYRSGTMVGVKKNDLATENNSNYSTCYFLGFMPVILIGLMPFFFVTMWHAHLWGLAQKDFLFLFCKKEKELGWDGGDSGTPGKAFSFLWFYGPVTDDSRLSLWSRYHCQIRHWHCTHLGEVHSHPRSKLRK